MALSDDFRKQLQEGNIAAAFALALSEAVNLRVTTWVSSGADAAEAGTLEPAKPGHRLYTHINTIDGDIENEIGDQFLGNGPYRELRQFHLDQVAQGSRIIQENLEGLQRIFEVWLEIRGQTATTLVIEPETVEVEEQLLPPTEEPVVTDSVREPPDVAPSDTVAGAGTVVEEQVTPGLPPPSATDASLGATTAASSEAVDGETEQDDDEWDNGVSDLLESLYFESQSTSQTSDLEEDQDWEDSVTSAVPDDQPPQSSTHSSIEFLPEEEDDDWEDWLVEEPDPPLDAEVVKDSSLDLEDDEWDYFFEESEPFTAQPTFDSLAPDLASEEDWDDFDDEEFSSSSDNLDLDADLKAGIESAQSQPTQTDSEIFDENNSSNQEEAFLRPSEESEPSLEASKSKASAQEKDPLASSENDSDTSVKPTERRRQPPPPPPPSSGQFPRQNNEQQEG